MAKFNWKILVWNISCFLSFFVLFFIWAYLDNKSLGMSSKEAAFIGITVTSEVLRDVAKFIVFTFFVTLIVVMVASVPYAIIVSCLVKVCKVRDRPFVDEAKFLENV